GREQEAKPIRSQMGAIRAEQDRMKETTEKILERPSDPEPRCTAAQIQLRIHQPEQARLWLASALRRAPGYPRALRLMEEYERIKRRPVPGCSADGTGEPGQKKP
ncbi:MAG TPA: hypothetical protein VJ739_00675, partial [Gemmataceae bacterium]|nr:hypothetical protein [Gemmataceae bacterium]